MTAPIITDSSGVQNFAAEIGRAPAIALDTEFMREKTYRPELCLVQLATADSESCVDPLAVADLSALAAPLGPTGPLKVLHAARQDLEVLWTAVGPIAPVFDTQVAAALAGFPAQVGYADLVRELTGTELAKAHTRADWSKRPLSPEQIDYALDDVRFLLPMRDALLERLDRLGRSAWLGEELRALADPRSFTVEPDDAWRRLKGLMGLDPGRLRLARALAGWRERRAIDRNRPRGWILDDTVLREIILRVPRDEVQLGQIPGTPPNVLKHSGAELLGLVRDADIAEPLPPLPRRERPDPSATALVKKLGDIAKQVANEHELAAEVLVTRRDLERLASGDRNVPMLEGWRRAIVGERLLAAL